MIIDPVTITLPQAFNIIRGSITTIKKLMDDTSKRISSLEKAVENISHQTSIQNLKLDDIQERIDDQVGNKIATSFNFLLDAASRRETLHSNLSLDHAYKGFTELRNIPSPQKQSKINGKEFKNSFISSLGYYGRHLYFAILGEYENSLMEIYDCILRYPEEGLLVFNNFSKDFLSRDYYSELSECSQEIIEHSKDKSDLFYPGIFFMPILLSSCEIMGDASMLDEEGVILMFQREEILDNLEEECNILRKAIITLRDN